MNEKWRDENGGNDFNINAPEEKEERVNNVQPKKAQPLKKKLQPPMEGGAGSADQSASNHVAGGHVCFYLRLRLVLFGFSGILLCLSLHPHTIQFNIQHTVRSVRRTTIWEIQCCLYASHFSPKHYKLILSILNI